MSLAPVSIVIVTYNSAHLLTDFFAALTPAMGDRDVQVTLVDNASTDSTVSLAKALWPTVVVVETGDNLGFAGAINSGVAASPDASHVLVLNPDIRLHFGAIDTLADTVEQDGVAIAGPLLLDEHGERQDSIKRFPQLATPWAHLFGGARASGWGLGDSVAETDQYETAGSVQWLTGGAVMMSRTAIERIGPWDETYFMYTEEVDFCRRCHGAGMKIIFEPAATAVRMVEGDPHPGALLYGIQAWNDYRFFRSDHGWLQSQVYRAGLFVLHLSRLPFRGTRTIEAMKSLVSSKSSSRRFLADRIAAIKANEPVVPDTL